MIEASRRVIARALHMRLGETRNATKFTGSERFTVPSAARLQRRLENCHCFKCNYSLVLQKHYTELRSRSSSSSPGQTPQP